MIIECVPNISEGRNAERIASIVGAISGVSILDCTSDYDHNRSVITFAGTPRAIENAAFEAAAAAVTEIDLTSHAGVHPRIGAIDVIPFVPVAGITLSECVAIAQRVAHRFWNDLRLPSFFYEAAADGRHLEAVRRAACSGAPPDTGMNRHATAGATAIGARNFLVAWNINLCSDDLALARNIARAIRFSSGGFPGVKALGLHLDSRNQVQVSINSTDFEATPLHVIFEAVAKAAGEAGVRIAGSELIGLIPERALQLSQAHDLQWQNLQPRMILENAIHLM